MRRPKPEGAALARFLESVRLGLPVRDACARAGWSHQTAYNWQDEAKKAIDRGGKRTERERVVIEFLDAWQKADAEFVAGHVAIITRAAQAGTWQAAAWMMERRRAKEFGRQLIEITGPDGGPIQVEEQVGGVLQLLDKAQATTNGHKEGVPQLNGDVGAER